MSTTQKLIDELEKKYCPPLDTALFLTIISDYDLTKPAELQSARLTLDSLTEGFEAEEATGFDASGSGGNLAVADHGSDANSKSGHSGQDWGSSTEESSLSQGMNKLEIESLASESSTEQTKERHARDSQFDEMTMEAKEAMLAETFPDAKPFDIKWTLKHCKGDASLAIDELLNQSFLESNGGQHKGIEAFSDHDLPVKARKGKKKRQKYTSLSEAAASKNSSWDTTPVETASHWQHADKDIDFISDRANMPRPQVATIYYDSGGSMQSAINTIINGHMEIGLDTTSPIQQKQAQLLAQTYPAIAISRLIALIQITHPSLASAEDLAKVLITKPLPKAPVHTPSNSATPIQISFQMAPPDLGEYSPSTSHPPRKHLNTLYRDGEEPSLYPSPAFQPSDKAHLTHLRQNALQNAHSAHRASKSNPLMGGAAAYYSSVSRDLSSRIHQSTASEMDMLVASQSTSTSCDLHGVDVKNGVRIARERVRAWWGSGRAIHTGYTIVTGRGRHSEGGVSKLRPAILKCLMQEGWRVEVLSGELIVRGVNSGGTRRL